MVFVVIGLMIISYIIGFMIIFKVMRESIFSHDFIKISSKIITMLATVLWPITLILIIFIVVINEILHIRIKHDND